ADHLRIDRAWKRQSGAHGGGDRRDARVRPDHATVRPVASDVLEVRWRKLHDSRRAFAADLPHLFSHDHLLYLLSGGGAVAAENAASGIGRLLQESRWYGLHLPAAIGLALFL